MRYGLFIALILLSLVTSNATISSSIVWEIRQTATAGNVNGGGFKTGATGTDYSQQDAAQYNLTLVTTAAADAILLSTSAAADMVGNIAHIISGVNFTAGWYEIISVVPGVSITLDRTCTTAAGTTGVVNIGGSMSLGSTLDDDLFEVFVGGNRVWQKAGTEYTLGETISVISTSPTVTANIFWEGYNATRGDAPTGTSRPSINSSTGFAVTTAANWTVRNMIVRGSATTIFTVGSDSRLRNCKISNSSSTASRTALTLDSGCTMVDCEAICQNGVAVSASTKVNVMVLASYIHDSDRGLVSGIGTGFTVAYTIFENCKTDCFSTSATSARSWLINNTFYGAFATPIGKGITGTGATTGSLRAYNNIFRGLATGMEIATVLQDAVVEDFNDFSNNTTDRTLVTVGPNSITNSPLFVGTVQITGSTATTITTQLIQSGGDFSAVTDNIDYVRVVSGTSVTPGIYLITGHTGTTLGVNNSIGTSSAGDVVYVVYTGHNYAIGSNLPGFPGAFNSNASETTGFLQMGAVQKVSTGGGGGSSVFVFP